MCEPITLAMAALGGAASLFGGGDKPPPPPPPVIPPARDPATTREAGAEVKLGDGALKPTSTSTPQYEGFSEKRITGKPLGGLGRGGLGL